MDTSIVIARQLISTNSGEFTRYRWSKLDPVELHKFHCNMVERSAGNLRPRSLDDWEQASRERRCVAALVGSQIVGAAYVERVHDESGKFQAELRALSVLETHRKHFREYESSIALLLISEAEVVAAALKFTTIRACTPYVSLFWRSGWTVERPTATQFIPPESEALAVPASVRRTSNREKVWLYKPLASTPYAY